MNENHWRQKLHLEPPHGWLNDPNGCSYFNGKYHIYFQYAPDSAEGKGKKCWGHYESPDWLHWDFTGTVLVPDIPQDRDGVYSGCGVPTDDTLHLFYTGNVKEKGNYDYINEGRGVYVIHVETKDGHQMSSKSVLLGNEDYPDYCSCHVRDPKVWYENGRWNMVLGARSRDSKGLVLFYISDDLMQWTFDHSEQIPDFGFMWECPDFFSMDGQNYLSASPQGLPHEKDLYQNVYSSGYFMYNKGNLDRYEEWDKGFDFYAPQTFETPDHRRIIIGWMGIGDIPYTNPTTKLGWQHCLTLPREVTRAEDGNLLQQPIRELGKLRQDKSDLSDGGNICLQGPFEILANADHDLEIQLDGLSLTCRDGEARLSFTDDGCGFGRTDRYALIGKGSVSARMIVDTSSAEIYLNGGRIVFSTRFYPKNPEIAVCIKGCSSTIYTLKEMEVHLLGE